MSRSLVPVHWWRPLLIWWGVLALSLALVLLLAPKRYTAESAMLFKKDRLPWDGFKTSTLPTYTPREGEEDLASLQEELTGGASLSLWKEVSLTFLLDQLAFDAYDFRPFLTSRTATLAAVERSGQGAALGAGEVPDDLFALEVAADLEVELDESTNTLRIAYTASDPATAEAMVAAYQGLLIEQVNAMLDAVDAVALQRITERVDTLAAEVERLDAEAAEYAALEGIVAPTSYLGEKYKQLLNLRERAARHEATAAAADAYIAILDARLIDTQELQARTLTFDLGAHPDDRPLVSDLIYRDPVLARQREDLARLEMEQERDLQSYTPEHPRVIGRAELLAAERRGLVSLLVKNSRAEVADYVLESIAAHARAGVLTEAADRLEQELDFYPTHEKELISLFRTRRIQTILLGRMRELQSMAESMIQKQEILFRPLDSPYASSRATEPNGVLFGVALFTLGTIAAGGWLALRDRLAAPPVA